MVRQAHHERVLETVRPEIVEGLIERFCKKSQIIKECNRYIFYFSRLVAHQNYLVLAVG
jgi:hypothetical protein